MKQRNDTANSASLLSLAEAFLDTLEEEHTALLRMHDHFEKQLEAVRRRDHDLIESAAVQTSDEVNVLARLRQIRSRQIRLLGRILRLESGSASIGEIAAALEKDGSTTDIGSRIMHMRETVRTQASQTQERCRDLEFALDYSIHLGHELLEAITGANESGGGRHYTPDGGTVESTSGKRSFLNRVG